jgi:hypothetical protein
VRHAALMEEKIKVAYIEFLLEYPRERGDLEELCLGIMKY